jgi:hypothetical protein
VTFNRRLAPAEAERAGAYAIEGAAVRSATLDPDGRTVVLETAPLEQGRTYRLSVRGVQSADENAIPVDDVLSFVPARPGDGTGPHGSSGRLRPLVSGTLQLRLRFEGKWTLNSGGRRLMESYDNPYPEQVIPLLVRAGEDVDLQLAVQPARGASGPAKPPRWSWSIGDEPDVPIPAAQWFPAKR